MQVIVEPLNGSGPLDDGKWARGFFQAQGGLTRSGDPVGSPPGEPALRPRSVTSLESSPLSDVPPECPSCSMNVYALVSNGAPAPTKVCCKAHLAKLRSSMTAKEEIAED